METSPTKVFTFDKLTAFFKHTDYHGFVHPYNFFEWTSYVREAFFQETVSNFEEILSRLIKMMTVKITCSSLNDSRFGDNFQARLTVGKIKRVSFDMIIRFWNLTRQQIASETSHTIVFVDSEKGQFAPIPEEIMRVIVHYEERSPLERIGRLSSERSNAK